MLSLLKPTAKEENMTQEVLEKHKKKIAARRLIYAEKTKKLNQLIAEGKVGIQRMHGHAYLPTGSELTWDEAFGGKKIAQKLEQK